MIIFRRTMLVVTTLYWGLLIYLTHTPKPPAIAGIASDKTEHFLAYGLLCGLVFVTVWLVRPKMRWIGAYVLAFAMIYGALDEWTQPWTGRTCDFWDWMCDSGGAMIAVGVLSVLRAGMGRHVERLKMTNDEIPNDESMSK
jgi:VanZ family protein